MLTICIIWAIPHLQRKPVMKKIKSVVVALCFLFALPTFSAEPAQISESHCEDWVKTPAFSSINLTTCTLLMRVPGMSQFLIDFNAFALNELKLDPQVVQSAEDLTPEQTEKAQAFIKNYVTHEFLAALQEGYTKAVETVANGEEIRPEPVTTERVNGKRGPLETVFGLITGIGMSLLIQVVFFIPLLLKNLLGLFI